MTALHATRAAVEEGIVPGGGVALARASLVLAKLKADNEDQRFGIEIVRKAMLTPMRQIAENAGEDGAVISGKVLEKDDYNFGFDAQTGEYKDMVKAGHHRPDQGGALARCSTPRPIGGADDHDRSDGRRARGTARGRLELCEGDLKRRLPLLSRHGPAGPHRRRLNRRAASLCSCVMAGLVPAIHDFVPISSASRGWPD